MIVSINASYIVIGQPTIFLFMFIEWNQRDKGNVNIALLHIIVPEWINRPQLGSGLALSLAFC